MKPIAIIRFILIISLLIAACGQSGKPGKMAPAQEEALVQESLIDEGAADTETRPMTAPGKYHFPYELKTAASEYELSKELKEISALSLSADGRHLLAVNDEQGKIFFLDKKNGSIVRDLKFGGSGDYEGIEAVGERIFVARSDGALFEIWGLDGKEPQTRVHHTPLSPKHDVEGLAYDGANNRLLLACKGIAGEGAAYKNKKGVYAFSLGSMQLSNAPVYLISAEMPLAGEAIREAWWQDVLDGYFEPSAIAAHPRSGHIYMLSAQGKARAILVLNSSGEVLHIGDLDKDPFNQPEGICFDKDGTLFISTEAKGKKGKGKVIRARML